MASKLIVNEIEHTDGSGTAVTLANATITTGSIPAAGITGTLPNAVQDNVTRLGTVTTGTMNNTIGSSATFPAGIVIKEQAFDEVATISGGSTTFASGNTMSFTKLKASADSYIVYTWNGYIDKYANAGSHLDWRMVWDDTHTTDIRGFDFEITGEYRIYYPMCYQVYVSNMNAGAANYKMQARWGGGTPNNNSQLVTDVDQYVFIKEVSK